MPRQAIRILPRKEEEKMQALLDFLLPKEKKICVQESVERIEDLINKLKLVK